MNKITETVYQGNVKDAFEASKTKSVDAIIYLGQLIPEELSYSKLPIVHIPMNDGHNSKEKLELALTSIIFMAQDLVILIACRAGLSRSVALTIGYLMSYKGMSYGEAYLLVKKKIPKALPELTLMKGVRKVALSIKEQLGEPI